jgi:peptidoglycan/xylan/chitin deacetylase (PgdA/CDA1 family)
MKQYVLGRLARILAVVTLGASIVVVPLGTRAAQAAPETVVSLTFNDGFTSQYSYARPLLNARGMKATFYVTTGAIDNGYACCASYWQLDELYRDGHEIGGMGRDRVDLTQVYNADPAQDYAYKQQQVCSDRQRLVQLGYDPQSFAYPYAGWNYTFPDGTTIRGIVQGCGYRSGRPIGGLSASGGPYAEAIPPQDAYALRTVGITSSAPITLSDLQDSVTAAAAQGGGWVPQVFDHVCHQGSADYASCMSSYHPIDDATLTAYLDWLKNAGAAGGAPAGTSVKTVRQVMGAPAQPPLPTRPTVVSLTFDDGLASQFQARSILRNNGMRATFYLNSGDIDARDAGAMTWSNARTLNGDGNDMGGHTVHHIDMQDPNLTDAQKTAEVCNDRQRLIQQSLPSPASFAYPFGSYNDKAKAIVRSCGYQSARSAGGVGPPSPNYAETIPPRDAYGTWALNAENDGPITLAFMQNSVRQAASHGGGWVQMIFHEICYRSKANFSSCMAGYRVVDSSVLNSFLSWLRTSAPAGTSVKTVKQVMSGA